MHFVETETFGAILKHCGLCLSEHVIILPYVCLFDVSDLEVAYNRCGWKVWILQETAVADFEGTSNFFSDNDLGNLEWGGTIIGR